MREIVIQFVDPLASTFGPVRPTNAARAMLAPLDLRPLRCDANGARPFYSRSLPHARCPPTSRLRSTGPAASDAAGVRAGAASRIASRLVHLWSRSTPATVTPPAITPPAVTPSVPLNLATPGVDPLQRPAGRSARVMTAGSVMKASSPCCSERARFWHQTTTPMTFGKLLLMVAKMVALSNE